MHGFHWIWKWLLFSSIIFEYTHCEHALDLSIDNREITSMAAACMRYNTGCTLYSGSTMETMPVYYLILTF